MQYFIYIYIRTYIRVFLSSLGVARSMIIDNRVASFYHACRKCNKIGTLSLAFNI